MRMKMYGSMLLVFAAFSILLGAAVIAMTDGGLVHPAAAAKAAAVLAVITGGIGWILFRVHWHRNGH